MTHAFATDFGLNNFDSALFTDHTTMPHPLIFAAIALVIFGRTKDFGTEKTIPFWFEGSIVNGFGFLYLAVRPRTDLLGRGDRDFDGIETERIFWLFKQIE